MQAAEQVDFERQTRSSLHVPRVLPGKHADFGDRLKKTNIDQISVLL